jgi:ABC-type multidrug transport system ATPase subunit
MVRPFRVLLLDEPYGGLDPEAREDLTRLLEQIVSDGSLVLLSTHNLDAMPSSARVLRMHDGHLLTPAT